MESPIRWYSTLAQRGYSAASFAILAVFHCFSAVFVSLLLGFVPDGLISERAFHSGFFAVVPPFVTGIAVLFGYVIARWLRLNAAKWAFVPGMLWFAFGFRFELLPMGRYAAQHGLSPSAVQYVFAQLLTTKCGDTECFYQLFYTWPAIVAIAYSLSSGVTLALNRPRISISEKSP